MADGTTKSAEKTQDPAQEMADSLLKDVLSHGRRVTRVRNLLKAVRGSEPSPQTYAEWLELSRGLNGYEIGVAELDEKREQLVEQIDKGMQRLRTKTRMVFGDELKARAKSGGIALEKISDVPLVFYAEPLTFEVDFDAGEAKILFGHELICEVGISARELFDARGRALTEMKAQAIESEEFFDLLRAAYRTVLAAEGLEEGERVDLVDVLVPLSMLRVNRKDWRKKGIDALKPFTRYQLAWQLSRLRAESMLERGGARLDLGAATGGSTRDKQNVLYIPLGSTTGQYYGSIRFARL